MTYFPTPDHAMNHPRHSTGENTPADQIQAWKRANGWFICERLNAGLTAQACKGKRRQAKLIKKYLQASGVKVVSSQYSEAEVCLTCKEYPR